MGKQGAKGRKEKAKPKKRGLGDLKHKTIDSRQVAYLKNASRRATQATRYMGKEQDN